MSTGFEGYPLLSALDSKPDYCFDETFEGVALYGRSPHPDLLTDSNWSYIMRNLSPLEGFEESVVVVGARHNLCGPIQLIYIRPEASDAIKRECERFLAALADYPALDEEDYSRRCWEAAEELWQDDPQGLVYSYVRGGFGGSGSAPFKTELNMPLKEVFKRYPTFFSFLESMSTE